MLASLRVDLAVAPPAEAAPQCSSHVATRKRLRQGLPVPVLLEAHSFCSASPELCSSLRTRASNGAAPASPPWAKLDARLVLQDGSVWHGTAFGATGTGVAEVVFNTALTGYQEILTDPSYRGQYVVFTHPHIGNTGINADDMESEDVHLNGIIVRDLACAVSNYRSTISLADFLKERGKAGIANVDTRAITRRLRDTGALNGVITSDASISDQQLIEQAANWTIRDQDLIGQVSCAQPYEWKDPTVKEWEFSPSANGAASGSRPFHVVAYDCGIKLNIMRRLAAHNCRITVVPARHPPEQVLELNPDGIFLSNGPGDPAAAPYMVDTVKQLLGKKPMFGICLGHQVMGTALGSPTFKLKFGHHGGNHPIRFNPSGRVEISAQNHNYAVDPAALDDDVEVTHINLNDGTCAGLLCKARKAMSIQYHPEASPGPHDGDVSFDRFIEMMQDSAPGPKVPLMAV